MKYNFDKICYCDHPPDEMRGCLKHHKGNKYDHLLNCSLFATCLNRLKESEQFYVGRINERFKDEYVNVFCLPHAIRELEKDLYYYKKIEGYNANGNTIFSVHKENDL